MKLAVIGLGLIGGSLARALRAAGVVQHVTGYDLDPKQRRLAVDLGVVDSAPDTPEQAVAGADVVVLAVPVLRTGAVLSAVLPALAPHTVVTDVGSTKGAVIEQVMAACNGSLPSWFVAAHPIAGTEQSGVAAGFAELFRGKRLILCPHPQQDAAALATVRQLWLATGARVVEMDATQHDAIFAATSHLPHLLAYCFVEMLTHQAGAEDFLPNAGGGFRDFTRIASSNPEMWQHIVEANAQPVLALLDAQIDSLKAARGEIAEGRWHDLQHRFETARAARERYLRVIE